MNSHIYYYVTGHTASGFVNYLESNVQGLDYVIILHHSSHTLKTAVLKQFIMSVENDYQVEILVSPLGHGDLDGVIVRDKSIAIVIDTVIDLQVAARLKGVIEINLALFTGENKMIADNTAWTQYEGLTAEAHDMFKAGLDIHDELEAIYINEMNFAKADEMAETFIEEVLREVQPRTDYAAICTRMFGTNTSEGAVNVVPELIAPFHKRYYLKGRAGTGKSSFMKRVIGACESYGLDMELYYCSFDPNSIDMVLVREIGLCIFDSTDPHEFFPENHRDKVIDLYEKTVVPGTDEKYAGTIHDLTIAYKSYMKRGINKLNEARAWLDEQTDDTMVHERRVIGDVISFIQSKVL